MEILDLIYFASVVGLVYGLKAMGSPKTAMTGLRWSGIAMLAAVVVTFFHPHSDNFLMTISAVVLGSLIAFISAKRVQMTDMPQMVAIYNGMGGGAAAAISVVEMIVTDHASHEAFAIPVLIIGCLGAIIGSMSFSGSCVAFLKLQGWMRKNLILPQAKQVNLGFVLAIALFCVIIVLSQYPSPIFVAALVVLCLVFGVIITGPIGGADMPVIISLFNAFTGLAVALEGFLLNIPALIVAGMVVGSSGTMLTILMAKAMNRSITKIIFSPFGATAETASSVEGEMKERSSLDLGYQLSFANKVLIVPGYGMAVAQAQHKLWELCGEMMKYGIEVKFAIHPVAGRMPGHMNVLLAEAGVDYEYIFDLEEINADFETADATIVIGANDVVNPAAVTDEASPIYGMPILDAYKSKEVYIVKRGKGAGFSGLENQLFFNDNSYLVYGDAQKVLAQLVSDFKQAIE